MTFTCQNCGATSDTSENLCKPTDKKPKNKFCGAAAVEVCDDKIRIMKFTCDACGSVSAQPENLCNPREFR